MLQKKKKENVNSNTSRCKITMAHPFNKIFVAQPISQFVRCDK